jgi:mediator of RNA polymerase II transcription subunit 10
MALHEASTPQRGGATANLQSMSHSPSSHDDETGMAASPPGAHVVKRTAAKFDNRRDQRVRRHQKTSHVYRIGIRLPKEKLQRFPRYDGKIKDFWKRWAGSFITFKIAPWRLRSVVRKPLVIIVPPPSSSLPAISTEPTTSAASVPLLLSAGPSSAPDTGPDTPVTADFAPEAARASAPAKRIAADESIAVTSGLLPIFASVDSPFPLSSQPGSVYEDIPVSERLIRNSTMAPVKDTTSVHNTIKEVIQHLTDVQIQTHGYIPATQDLLVDKLTDLTQSLAELKRLTSPNESPNNYIHQVAIAPEIVDYVDDGRNPDIFTRDFVEIVQRGNAVINGKQQAFKDFTEVFAQKLKEGIPGVSGQVDRVLRNAGFEEHDRSRTNGAAEGSLHPEGSQNEPANS